MPLDTASAARATYDRFVKRDRPGYRSPDAASGIARPVRHDGHGLRNRVPAAAWLGLAARLEHQADLAHFPSLGMALRDRAVDCRERGRRAAKREVTQPHRRLANPGDCVMGARGNTDYIGRVVSVDIDPTRPFALVQLDAPINGWAYVSAHRASLTVVQRCDMPLVVVDGFLRAEGLTFAEAA